MAEVWLGRALGFGGFEKLVVLKTILPNLITNPQFVQMFINEARVAAMLNHPNCVQIFELGKEEGVLYIAMEYIEGFSFSRVLKRAKAQGVKVPLEILARIAADALAGLEYAHKLTDREGKPVGLIHRDVSPDNLLISFAGQTKLVDFGIAKASLSAAQATRAGTVKGKFGYIAPEYLRGQPIDGRADLFALGVVLYRAITGRRPFTGPSEASISLAVLKEDPPWPTDIEPSLPQAMSAVVMMALEKQPDSRFSSAKAMRQAIEQAVRPADAEDVGALLNKLWPPGDPERVALETLAAGRAEETSEPLLESIISTGVELPPDARATGPHASVDAPEPDSQAATAVAPAPSAGAPLLGPEPVSKATVVEPKVKVHPASVPDDDDDEPPVRKGGAVKWAVLGLSVLAGAAAVWKLRPGAKPSAPPPVVVTPRPQPEPPPAAPEPEPPPPEVKRGVLSVKADPWAYVKIDGKSFGQTPVRKELEPGSHTVELSNTELNVTKRVEVVIKPGETRALNVKLE